VATILTRHGEYLDKSPTSVLMTPDAWAMVDRWTLPRRCNLSSLVMMVREGALTDEERKTHKIVTMVSGWALSHAVDTPPEIVATSNWKLSMTIDEARDFLNLLVAPFGNAGVVVKHSQSASERRHFSPNTRFCTFFVSSADDTLSRRARLQRDFFFCHDRTPRKKKCRALTIFRRMYKRLGV
jgi:hypothetical protein